MLIKPTKRLPYHRLRSHLTIGVIYPDGHTPISWFRGMNVGVGGKRFPCPIAQGEPIRKATLNELRRLDRIRIAELRREHPDAEIFVARSSH